MRRIPPAPACLFARCLLALLQSPSAPAASPTRWLCNARFRLGGHEPTTDVPGQQDAKFSSKAYGTHEYKEITIEGRVQFDLMLAIQRDYKLSSYSLNAVSAHFLNEQKEDVHHSCISELQVPHLCVPPVHNTALKASCLETQVQAGTQIPVAFVPPDNCGWGSMPIPVPPTSCSATLLCC